LLIDAYARLYEFEAVSMRIFSAYGPHLRRQVIWDIANKAQKADRSHVSLIKLHGTGEETRDFIYVGDIASIAVALASASLPRSSLVVNVGAGLETKIRALAEQIIGVMGLKVEVAFSEAPRPGDPNRWCADISLLRSLGCTPATPLSKGLEQFADWFKREVAL
jgi:nucleoside-diphosphate-sugar epimerase